MGEDERGRILWRQDGRQGAPVGRLAAGATPLAPRLEIKVADGLGGLARDAVRRRLAQWLDAHLANLTRPLLRLQAAELEGPGRGLAFHLVEGLGNVRTARTRPLLRSLGPADRAQLTRHGVRFGVRHVDGGAFVSCRDDTNAEASQLAADGLHMGARQSVGAGDALRADEAGDGGSDRGSAGLGARIVGCHGARGEAVPEAKF